MATLNKVFLLGRLSREVDHRGTQTGNSVCTLGVVTSRKFTVNGQEKEETCFVDVKVWGKLADNCKQYLSKGSQVMIEGRLTLDQWEDRNTGEKRQKLNVTAEAVQFIGGKRDNDESRSNGGYQRQQQSSGVDSNYAPPPQSQHQQAKADGYQQDNGVDDDIPF